MSSKRYTEEFKIEAVRQVTGRDYSVAENLARNVQDCSNFRRVYLAPTPFLMCAPEKKESIRSIT